MIYRVACQNEKGEIREFDAIVDVHIITPLEDPSERWTILDIKEEPHESAE